jgi:hypothetical protein
MTPQKVVEVLKQYEEFLRNNLYEPVRGPTNLYFGSTDNMEEVQDNMHNHLLWMCVEAQKFLVPEPCALVLATDKVEKAMRWLGFIQGGLVCLGDLTIDEAKEDNMPDSEKSLE